MNEEMAVDITNLLDDLKRLKKEESTNDEKVKAYKAISKIFDELDKQRNKILSELDETSRQELLNLSQDEEQIEIPEYLLVGDVSELLNITPQMVRRYCAEGKIQGHQTLEGSGKWKIPTEQFKNHPNWDKFIQDKRNMQKNNMKTADTMLKMLARED